MSLDRLRAGWREVASRDPKKVLLADGEDLRAIEAALELTANGVVEPGIVGDRTRIGETADAAGMSLPPELIVHAEDDPLTHAARAVGAGEADAMVGGATRPTGDVIRAAVAGVGRPSRETVVSSLFLMGLPNGAVVAYADGGVVPEPDETQLAQIASATADSFRHLTGSVPRIAMLSFSTLGSASHAAVDKVIDATALVRHARPDLKIDGELQFDAAFDARVAASKAPGSEVAGDANVFIFPNLDAANIAYKITERVGGATALGPLLQGLNRPVHDVSRGCSAADIADVALIAGYQASPGYVPQ